MEKIDFVITWVDGNDPNWLKEKNNYSGTKEDYSNKNNRFREWDNLQYWFRGVEKFAPWVNHIFFVTWGHIPEWLNVEHPKLTIVNHKDYIPEKYLPTFNSNVIELNLNRLDNLSEKFVLFNDDVFIIKTIFPEDFFQNGKPVDEMIENPILPKGERFRISYTNLNNTSIINSYFSKREIYKKHWRKIFNIKYGKEMIRTVCLLPWNSFAGFKNPHITQPHLKSTFDKLWNLEYTKLDETCLNKFRGLNDLNHWVMRYWNLCSGDFTPRSHAFGKYYNISNNNVSICEYIEKQTGKVVCLNDMDDSIDFEVVKREINGSLEKILSEKSGFEI